MNRNVQPTSGQTLESVFHILESWHPQAIDRLYVKNEKRERIRIMVAGALFFVGAASPTLIARLLKPCSIPAAQEMVLQYEDAPRSIRDPWEYAVRKLAYVVRDEPDSEIHKKCANDYWIRMPEVVKWALDPNWRQKVLVTGGMIAKLREAKAAGKWFEPGIKCRMCRKLYRARLLKRSVRLAGKVPIIRYTVTDKGLSVLEQVDASQPERSPGDDPKRDRPDAAATH